MTEEFLSKISMYSGKDISILRVFFILNKGETTLKLKSPLCLSYYQLIMAQNAMIH